MQSLPPVGSGAPESTDQFTARVLHPLIREFLRAALVRNGWNVGATARELGCNRTQFYRTMHRYGISPVRKILKKDQAVTRRLSGAFDLRGFL